MWTPTKDFLETINCKHVVVTYSFISWQKCYYKYYTVCILKIINKIINFLYFSPNRIFSVTECSHKVSDLVKNYWKDHLKLVIVLNTTNLQTKSTYI